MRWAIEGEGEDARLNLLWRELGGPPVVPPERSGFGRRLIERSVCIELRVEALLDFRPEGLVGHISIPARAAVAHEAGAHLPGHEPVQKLLQQDPAYRLADIADRL